MKTIIKELNDFYTGKANEFSEKARNILLSIDFIKRVEPSMPLKGDATDVQRIAQCKALSYYVLTPLGRSRIELLGVKKSIYRALGKRTWLEWIGRGVWWVISAGFQ